MDKACSSCEKNPVNARRNAGHEAIAYIARLYELLTLIEIWGGWHDEHDLVPIGAWLDMARLKQAIRARQRVF